ncbi:unnamed protein product [Gadus morhua 'NCC']
MPLVVANGGVLSRFGLGGESSQALFGILPAGTGESIDPTEPLNLSAELVTLTPVELAFEEPSTSQSPVFEEMWNPPPPPPPPSVADLMWGSGAPTRAKKDLLKKTSAVWLVRDGVERTKEEDERRGSCVEARGGCGDWEAARGLTAAPGACTSSGNISGCLGTPGVS